MLGIVKKLKIWQMNRKIARWEQIIVMFGHGVLLADVLKLKAEQDRLAKEIITLEEELGVN